MGIRRFAATGLALSLVQAASGQTPSLLRVIYSERPPYAVTQPGGLVTGLTATPTTQALRAAGIPFQWLLLPSARALAVIKEGQGVDCGIGWFRNPERKAFAQFSKPLYQDRPMVALAHVDVPLRNGDRLADVLASRELIVLVKDKFSYGPYIDALLAQLKPTTTTTSVENAQMLQMIERHRVDLMFAAEEEAEQLLQMAGPRGAQALKVVHFSDVPEGEKRYLMCSKQVPREWLDRIDAALSR
jgi:polar amino acid transport system substrate-binding protein